ncbi:hypothetical protein [Dyella humicola]|uniref:hypothetical protein n=1 Tax=Dyella humicola TaxID=2992126 RepID=UPI0022503800|nr:hypothetical protein [Dyella humicola]
MSFNWTFDPRSQTLRAPSGLAITVREIAQMLADRRDCRYDFAGDWSGWKMRGNKLIPPHTGKNGPKLTPQNAKLFLVWVNEPSRESCPRNVPRGRPSLRLVYTRSL